MNFIFKKLDEYHIDQGWLDWTSTINLASNTEFGIRSCNRQDLINIVKNDSHNDIWLAAYFCDNNKEIYFANVHIGPINWINRTSYFGRLIGLDSMRGKGLGTALTKEIINYSFLNLGLRKVSAGCSSLNIAAIKSNLKAGMYEEATLIKEKFHRGKFIDVKIFSALKDTWLNP